MVNLNKGLTLRPTFILNSDWLIRPTVLVKVMVKFGRAVDKPKTFEETWYFNFAIDINPAASMTFTHECMLDTG